MKPLDSLFNTEPHGTLGLLCGLVLFLSAHAALFYTLGRAVRRRAEGRRLRAAEAIIWGGRGV